MTEYKENKKHIQKTIELSKQAFYKGLESRQSTWSQFLTGQIRFIRKRWWVLQFLILTLLWSVMYLGNSKSVLRREAAALIPLFGMMLMPELWRNVYYHSTEVENTSCFTMRQIYAARLTIFSLADLLLLTIFFLISMVTVRLTLLDMIIHFMIPLNVTACICLGTLCWRRIRSEYAAVGLFIIWVGICYRIINNEPLYHSISLAMWIGLMLLSFAGMFLTGKYLLKTSQQYAEEGLLWN